MSYKLQGIDLITKDFDSNALDCISNACLDYLRKYGRTVYRITRIEITRDGRAYVWYTAPSAYRTQDGERLVAEFDTVIIPSEYNEFYKNEKSLSELKG